MTRSMSPNKTRLLTPVALVAVQLLGCQGTPYAYLEADDLRMEPVQRHSAELAEGRAEAERSGAEAESWESTPREEYGDVYVMSLQGAHEVNGWVGELIESTGLVIDLLAKLPPTATEGEWWRYGPHDEVIDRNLSWLIRLSGDVEAGQFEIWVGERGAASRGAMDLLLEGEIEIEGSRRRESLVIDFDTLELHPELKAGPNNDRSFNGTIEIDLDRDLDSESKRVEIAYNDFFVTQEYPVPEFFSANRYSFVRDERGAGEFHVELSTTFQSQIWSGPGVDDMRLDLRSSMGRTGGRPGRSQHP